MKSIPKHLIAMAALLFGAQAAAQETRTLNALLTQDVRLATVAERMLSANAALCRQLMPITGVVLHSRDQYRNGTEGDAFANGRIAVAAVVPGSPAAAMLAPRDGIAAIASTRADTMTAVSTDDGEAPLRDSAFAALAASPAEGPVPLTIMRDGREQTISLPATPGCRALVEIRAENQLNARSDGRVIQVNYGIAARATDSELAVIFAHEFAHLVLEHRRRLSAAGVEKGFFGEFGRNQNLNRLVEVEADRMTVHLLANAGYDPQIAPSFWRSNLGKSAAGGILRSRTYPSAESRAQLGEREIADYMGGGVAPSWPGHLLARRDIPFE